jgi:hypothetical protein
MAVRMVYDDTINTTFGDGGYIPRFACDQCGRLIDDPVEALVLWVVTSADDTVIQPVFHAHRGACDRALKAKLEAAENAVTYWEGLAEHSLHLANNLAARGRGADAVPLVTLTDAHPLFGR